VPQRGSRASPSELRRLSGGMSIRRVRDLVRRDSDGMATLSCYTTTSYRAGWRSSTWQLCAVSHPLFATDTLAHDFATEWLYQLAACPQGLINLPQRESCESAVEWKIFLDVRLSSRCVAWWQFFWTTSLKPPHGTMHMLIVYREAFGPP
jgi:hypothetical protein